MFGELIGERGTVIPTFDFSSFFQFDLVCSKSIYGTLAIASVFVGFFVGAIIIGPFTDKFGRKPTIFLSGFVIALFSLVSAFPKVFWLFVVFKILVGLGVGKRCFGECCCQCLLLFVNSWSKGVPSLRAVI